MLLLSDKMRREEHVVEAVPAKDDPIASGESIDPVKDLIPRVLRHKTDEGIETDDCLFFEMVKNDRQDEIRVMLTSNIRSRFKKSAHRHRYLLDYENASPS